MANLADILARARGGAPKPPPPPSPLTRPKKPVAEVVHAPVEVHTDAGDGAGEAQAMTSHGVVKLMMPGQPVVEIPGPPEPTPATTTTTAAPKKAKKEKPPPAPAGLGPFVITRKDKVGVRCWNGSAWAAFDQALVFDTVADADAVRPARTKVLTASELQALPEAVLETPGGPPAPVVAPVAVEAAVVEEEVAAPAEDETPENPWEGWVEAPSVVAEPEVALPPVGSIVSFVIPSTGEIGRMIPADDYRQATLDVDLLGVVDLHKSNGYVRIRYGVELDPGDGQGERTLELISSLPAAQVTVVELPPEA